jgi:hypothetical protein
VAALAWLCDHYGELAGALMGSDGDPFGGTGSG